MYRANTRRDWQLFCTLLRYVGESPGWVGLALILLLVGKLTHVAIPLVFKVIVDTLDTPHAVLTLPFVVLAGYGGLRLVSSVGEDLHDLVCIKVIQPPLRRILLQVFTHLHALALRFHLQRETGGVSRDIERGARGIQVLLSLLLFTMLPVIVELGLTAGILLSRYDLWYAVITFGTLVIYSVFTCVITERRMTFRHVLNDLDSHTHARAIDSLLNYETVKYFSNEAGEAERYAACLRHGERATWQYHTALAAWTAAQNVIIALGTILLMVRAGHGVAQGTLTLGDFVLVHTLLLQVYLPLHALGLIYREGKHALADIAAMFRLLEQTPEIQDQPGAVDLVVGEGTVRFAHVDFSYEPNRPLLCEVDFTIPAGGTVAVVGASGAGKSTLARLLLRLYDVTGGQILIDGQDIRDVTQHSLRAAVGIVPQDVVLFNETLAYNIAYGRPGAGPDEIVQAATDAHLHHCIASLPQGYDTIVGERGLKLSGGEKQRVAMARVLLKRPRLLIFDEATAALDSRSERAIYAALRRLARGCTTLVIAHRLSTIMDVDQILVLDQGRIVERGTHRELRALGGRYAQMWAWQQHAEAGAGASVRPLTTSTEGVQGSRNGHVQTPFPTPCAVEAG
jgi:ATP-binding cassette subfamily B protein